MVNYHTLSSFRVVGKELLDDLFVNVLGVLTAEGLITLERVMHDGMKVKASAGVDTFRSQERIDLHLQEARRRMEALDASRDPAVNARQAAARRRAARERVQKLEAALQQFESLPQPAPARRKQPRVRRPPFVASARIEPHAARPTRQKAALSLAWSSIPS